MARKAKVHLLLSAMQPRSDLRLASIVFMNGSNDQVFATEIETKDSETVRDCSAIYVFIQHVVVVVLTLTHNTMQSVVSGQAPIINNSGVEEIPQE